MHISGLTAHGEPVNYSKMSLQSSIKL